MIIADNLTYWQSLHNILGNELNEIPEKNSDGSRKTYWHYYIFNKNNYNLKDANITDNKDVVFDKVGETELINGEKSFLFSSGSKSFPFKENYQHKFDLVVFSENGSTNLGKQKNKVLFKGLPAPQLSSLKIEPDEPDGSVYSSMYVYV